MAPCIRFHSRCVYIAKILGVGLLHIKPPSPLPLELTHDCNESEFWHQNLQIVFFISGCLHSVSDMSASLPPRDSGALRFFCMQALGIMLEDGFQNMFYRVGGQSGFLSRAIGYVWVLLFLSWSIAVWQKKEDVVFKMSALRSLGPPN